MAAIAMRAGGLFGKVVRGTLALWAVELAEMNMWELDFVSLRLFVAVVDQGNIAQASRVCGISASAISKRISDLEDRVGVALIERLRDGIEPTDAGRALYHHIGNVNREMERLKAELSEFTDGMKGHIRLWANSSAVTQFLPKDIKSYLQERPNVRIELREETSQRVIEAIRDGRTDIGIFSEHVGEWEGVRTRIYRRDTIMVIAPRGHVLEGRDGVTLAEAAEFDHVGLQSGSSLQECVLNAARAIGTEIRMRVQVFGFDGIRQMVAAGLGIAVLPQGAVLPYLQNGSLIALNLDAPWATRNLLLGYRDDRELSLVSRGMVELFAPSAKT